MIAWDTETRNLRWWEGSAFLATWAGADYERVAVLPQAGDPSAATVFLDALADNDVLIAHNAKFDAHQTRETCGYCVFEHGHTVHDTALMSRILLGSQRWDHGLEGLSRDLLPSGGKVETKASASDVYKGLRGRTSMAYDDAYWDVWQAEPEVLEAYAMADVRDTYDLFELFWPQLEADPRLMQVYELELRVMRALYDAERRGVAVDPAAVADLKEHHAHAEAAAALELLEHLGFLPEGDGSDDQLRARLPEIGVPLTETTETGLLAVNQQALRAFNTHPAVAALFAWRKARKFQTTYLEPLAGVERVHTDVLQSEARTSRMSSRRPNMQNIPKRSDKAQADKSKRMRAVFVPSPGYEFMVMDYDQIEPRLFAWYLGDPNYRRIVAENRVYEQTCVAAWGGTEADYAKGGAKYALRDAGKLTYLSILYGAGARAVRDNVNKSAPPEYHVDVNWVKDPTNQFDYPPQAQAIKRKIIGSIPGFDDLAGTRRGNYGRIAKQVFNDGYVRTLLGRKQFCPKEDGRYKLYIMLNHLIQGSAAEILKLALVDVAAWIKPHGGHVLLPVHDELLCEVPKGKGEALLPQVVRIMESVVDIDPALTVEASVTDRSYAHA